MGVYFASIHTGDDVASACTGDDFASTHTGDDFAGALTGDDFASTCTQFLCQNYIYLFQMMNFNIFIAYILQCTVTDRPLICP
jgi:hypothetical protein